MFDHFLVHDDFLKCSEGHVLKEFQTKSFEDSGMKSYDLYERKLYVRNREEKETLEQVMFDLFVQIRISLEPQLWTGAADIYTHCRKCRPVLYVGSGGWMGSVMERQPWYEWRLLFKEGVWTDSAMIAAETRVTVRKELEKSGVKVLGDDETIAKLHFEKLKK